MLTVHHQLAVLARRAPMTTGKYSYPLFLIIFLSLLLVFQLSTNRDQRNKKKARSQRMWLTGLGI